MGREPPFGCVDSRLAALRGKPPGSNFDLAASSATTESGRHGERPARAVTDRLHPARIPRASRVRGLSSNVALYRPVRLTRAFADGPTRGRTGHHG